MGLLSTCVSAVGQAGRDLAFLNVGLGARASGMGTAYTALATDSHAAYWNPAGMMFAKAFQMSTMQAKLASDLCIICPGFSMTRCRQAIAIRKKKRAVRMTSPKPGVSIG